MSTVQFLADSLNQLDLALDQVETNDRNYDRFAIMLVDNVVELLLHRHAQNINKSYQCDQQMQKGFRHLTKGLPPEAKKKIPVPGKILCKYEITEKEIRNALNRNFAGRVALARKTELIDDALAGSLNKLHLIRNTAYHAGKKHEGTLNSLAIFYIILACDIFKFFDSGFGFSSSSEDKIPYRAKKYLDGDADSAFKNAWERVGTIATSLPFDLVSDLADDLQLTIDEVDETIYFCSMDGAMPRDQVVVKAQQLSNKAMKYAEKNSPKDVVGPFRIDWLQKNYPLRYKSDPVPGWRNRLESLQIETDLHKALDKYSNFMVQTKEIRLNIDEFGMEIDAMIQHRIDVARGK